MCLTLRCPTLQEEPEFLRAHRAASPEYPSFLHFYSEGMPFDRYIETLENYERGVGLPTGYVPTTFLFAFVSGRIVGRTSIRHTLNEFLHRVGGHIGYAVVPECRRRGYATEILRLSIGIARDRLGIGRALLTCDDDNIGSIKTIEKNGGVLENVITGPDLERPKRRYWITAASDDTRHPRSPTVA